MEENKKYTVKELNEKVYNHVSKYKEIVDKNTEINPNNYYSLIGSFNRHHTKIEGYMETFEDRLKRLKETKIDFNYYEEQLHNYKKFFEKLNEDNIQPTDEEIYGYIVWFFLSIYPIDNDIQKIKINGKTVKNYINGSIDYIQYKNIPKDKYQTPEVKKIIDDFLDSLKTMIKDGTPEELFLIFNFDLDERKNRYIEGRYYPTKYDINFKKSSIFNDEIAIYIFKYLKENINLFSDEIVIKYLFYTEKEAFFLKECYGYFIFDVDENETSTIHRDLYLTRPDFVNYEFIIGLLKRDINKSILKNYNFYISDRLGTIEKRYKYFIENIYIWYPLFMYDRFYKEKTMFSLYDKERTDKLEKEINKLFIKTYRVCLRHKKTMKRILNYRINYATKIEFVKEKTYYPETDWLFSNKSIKNRYLMLLLIVKKIMIKQSDKGIDVCKKYGITQNNFTNILFDL
jgi:nucleoid DNA-binding protein